MGTGEVATKRRFWAVPVALLPTLLMVALLTAGGSGSGSAAGGSQVVEVTVTAGK